MAALAFQAPFQFNTQSVSACRPPDFGQYRFTGDLGSGHFAEVRKVKHIRNGTTSAVKILTRNVIDERSIKKEIQMQWRSRHEHVVQMTEVVESPCHVFIVMELAGGGDLYDYLTNYDRLAETKASRLFQQLMSGVAHLHSKRVVHRDLKLENLLLDALQNLRIADFGVATTAAPDQWLTTSCGSPNYAAPELFVMRCRYKGPAVDVWSSGVILYTLLVGSFPFDEPSLPQLSRKVQNGEYLVPGDVSGDARDLIAKMLVVSPEHRISADQTFEDVWFFPRWCTCMVAAQCQSKIE